jgi:hypothetical protein
MNFTIPLMVSCGHQFSGDGTGTVSSVAFTVENVIKTVCAIVDMDGSWYEKIRIRVHTAMVYGIVSDLSKDMIIPSMEATIFDPITNSWVKSEGVIGKLDEP